MHIDPIEIDYHSPVFSGCSHALAIQHDNIPLVQRLFRMGYCDFGLQRFTFIAFLPFTQHINYPPFEITGSGVWPVEMLTINHELDYKSFHSLN